MSKREFHLRLALYMSLTVSLISDCGRIDLDLESTPTEEPVTSQDLALPSDVIQVLQITLNILQAWYPEVAPTDTLDWEADLITPSGSAGSSGYRFIMEEWQIDITHFVTAPESIVYSIAATHTTSDLDFWAYIDSNGEWWLDWMVVAWPGRIVSGLQAGNLHFEIANEVGTIILTSSDENILERLQSIRDDSGPDGFIHVWGILYCSTDRENHCFLEVNQMRSGTEITEPELIQAWGGILYARTGSPSSGGDDYFTMLGDYPIQYGIWARDETLRSELESLRDTGQAILIWGELTVGVPDWNGTQINVTRFRIVE